MRNRNIHSGQLGIEYADFAAPIPAMVGAPIFRNIGAKEVPHPIPYQGSKRALARCILRYFPTDADTLIEPFAGSGAVSLAAAYHGISHSFQMNDVNEPLINLWTAICDQPNTLADEYEKLWHDQDGRESAFYTFVRERFNRKHAPADFLYLLARCVKAAVRYNTQGEFNQSPDHRRKGAQPGVMRHHILRASALLHGRTKLISQDYEAALQNATPADIVYLDPPYQGTSGKRDSRYRQGLSFVKFIATLQDLNERQISYIVSYDGRTGAKTFGSTLPVSLGLVHHELEAGRSSQATLLGRSDATIESLYLSSPLVERLERHQSSGREGISRRILGASGVR